MKQSTRELLNKAENLDEFFKILDKYYDLKQAKIGIFARPTIMKYIDTFLLLVNAKEK